jgi:hypothetical protein
MTCYDMYVFAPTVLKSNDGGWSRAGSTPGKALAFLQVNKPSKDVWVRTSDLLTQRATLQGKVSPGCDKSEQSIYSDQTDKCMKESA